MKPEPTLQEAFEALKNKTPVNPPEFSFYDNLLMIAPRAAISDARTLIFDLIPSNHKGTRAPDASVQFPRWSFQRITQEALDLLHVHANTLNEIGKVFESDIKHNK